MKKEEDGYYHTQFKDLKYLCTSTFNQGRDGYLSQKNNPYPKYSHDRRNDWFVGFLYEQRLSNYAEVKKNTDNSLRCKE